MIARIWRGSVRKSDAAAYHDYLQKTGVKDYRACKGNRSVSILRRDLDDRTEFLILTLWDSLEAIKQFAGPEYERAVYYPEDKRFLLELEPNVEHYDVLTNLVG